jgi:small subunit ribosomal protein S3
VRAGARNEAPADGSDKPAEATDAPKTPAVKRVRKAATPGSGSGEAKGE